MASFAAFFARTRTAKPNTPLRRFAGWLKAHSVSVVSPAVVIIDPVAVTTPAQRIHIQDLLESKAFRSSRPCVWRNVIVHPETREVQAAAGAVTVVYGRQPKEHPLRFAEGVRILRYE